MEEEGGKKEKERAQEGWSRRQVFMARGVESLRTGLVGIGGGDSMEQVVT